MPNYGYHLARAQGSALRRLYAAMLPVIARRAITSPAEVPLEVYSYSSESALPEQVASIRSFLHHAGRPRAFTVVSDGSHSERSKQLLRQIDRSVVVATAAEWIPDHVHPSLRSYLAQHPTGKQLALIMSLPLHGQPALYVDSDVLFFRDAMLLRALASLDDAPARYLADCQLSADERLLRADAEKRSPINTGMLLLSRPLDWSLSIERFLALEGTPTFFTNQTMTHLTMHANAAQPFAPSKFVLQLNDQFIYRDNYAGDRIALRHYVNPVRHKFWTSLFR